MKLKFRLLILLLSVCLALTSLVACNVSEDEENEGADGENDDE